MRDPRPVVGLAVVVVVVVVESKVEVGKQIGRRYVGGSGRGVIGELRDGHRLHAADGTRLVPLTSARSPLITVERDAICTRRRDMDLGCSRVQ